MDDALIDQTILETKVAPVAYVAAAALGLAGVLSIVVAVQLYLGTSAAFVDVIAPSMAYIPMAMIAYALPCLFVATFLLRGRDWAAIGGTGLAVLGFIAMLAGFVYLVIVGLYSLLSVGAVFAWLVAAAMTPLSIKACLRSAGARERLRKAGITTGL